MAYYFPPGQSVRPPAHDNAPPDPSCSHGDDLSLGFPMKTLLQLLPPLDISCNCLIHETIDSMARDPNALIGTDIVDSNGQLTVCTKDVDSFSMYC